VYIKQLWGKDLDIDLASEIKNSITKSKQKRGNRTRSRRNTRRNKNMSIAQVGPMVDHDLIQGNESKFYSYTLATLGAITTTPNGVNMCNNIIQGLQFYSQRVGSLIKLKSLQLRATLVGGQSNVVTDDAYNTVRLVVALVDPACTFATLTMNSILGPRDQTGVHKVLYDKVITLSSPGADTTGYLPAVQTVSFILPLRDAVVRFTGSGANTVSNEALLIGCVSDSAASPSPAFVSGQALMYYTDN